MNLENPSGKYVAHVGIKPLGTLADTVTVLGEILSVSFLEDAQRRYDEFPAFIAEAANLRYALLGIPEPEEDLRDDPLDDFELMIEPINPSPQAQKTDVSEELVSMIEQDGRLVCWGLK